MISLKIYKTEELMNAVAGYLWEELQERLISGKRVLLLLSGGSAVEVYRILGERLSQEEEGFAKNLTVGLVDERYGSVGHSDSNEKQIQGTGFYEAVKEKGGHILSVLTGKDPEQEAAGYESMICKSVEEADEVLAVMGVGPDGHTAGILPQKSPEEFEKLFPANRWVVYYELPQDYPNPFKKRITLTPTALQKITLAVVVAKGEEKKGALRKVFTKEEPLYKTPATVLRNLLGILFTDQEI